LLAGRDDLLDLLFSPTSPDGARLSMLRLPLSATDFSPSLWTWDWDGAVATPPDEALAAADLVRDEILPRQPDLQVVGAPWTAPSSMKDGGSLRGGALTDAAETSYADLLVAQAAWLRDHGVPLAATTLVNEPGLSLDYPSMTMTDDQLARLGNEVGPRLDELGTQLWALDHNWSDRPRVDAVRALSGGFDAAAFHCYQGSPSSMASLSAPHLVTECSGTTDDPTATFAYDAKVLVADSVAAGSSGLMMWNLALDDSHGPVDAGSQWGCKDCRGLLTVTPTSAVAEPEFWTLAHLSRAASPGAQVISVQAPPGVSAAAFANPDGTLGLFAHNDTDAPVTLRIGSGSGPVRAYVVRPGELFTFRGLQADSQ
ncbi:glycoside hydrolase family 30 beta sandwich domain-containing protein, partial [Nocardioides hankookensis]